MKTSTTGATPAVRTRVVEILRSEPETLLTALIMLAALAVGLRAFGLGSSYWSAVLVLAGIYALLALGLNVVVGYGGLLDLGYAGFWAVGAYTTAMVTGQAPFHPLVLGLAGAVPLAVVATVVSGMVLGAVTLRLRGDYLAIVTLAFGEIVRLVANSADSITNGPSGVTSIPHPNILGYQFGLDPRPYVLLVWILIAVAALAIHNLWNSRLGRGLWATRLDEGAAESTGVPAFRMKMMAFGVGAATSGLAGVLYSTYAGFISPDNFTILVAILVLAAVVMGGMGHTSGVLLGGLAVVILPELLRDFAQARYLIFGLALVGMMILRPGGFLPARPRRYRLPPALPGGAGSWLGTESDPVAQPAPAIECRKVTVRFGGLVALNGVDLEIPAGTIFAVIGPNGAGKTTLFDVITGFGRPSAGTVVLAGRPLSGKTPHAIAALGLARTFQQIRLFPTASVAENVYVGADLRLRSDPISAVLRLPAHRKADRRARQCVADLLEFCGIGELHDRPAGTLSYGDQRRVEIARALATMPRALLLDEPAAGMNPEEKTRLGVLVRHIRDLGVTVLLIEHDMSLVMDVADRIAVLDHGVVIANGLPEEVRSNQLVLEAYLGVDAA